jgi:uncharacterized protein
MYNNACLKKTSNWSGLMKTDISFALNRPGAAVNFDHEKVIEKIIIAGADVLFVSPVKVTGTLMYTGEDFIVKGTIQVLYLVQCNRCTADIKENLKFDFAEEYAKQEDDNHPDRYLFATNFIDIEAMVLDNISLQVPMKHVCNEDCLGLCPICGGNLNEKYCDCIEEERMKTSPFAKIKELSIEDEV